jgi:hypothetical protein
VFSGSTIQPIVSVSLAGNPFHLACAKGIAKDFSFGTPEGDLTQKDCYPGEEKMVE